MGNLVEVHVPDIGDFKEVEVIELLVKPGDKVAPEQSLITVESDKASMEIPTTATGVDKELKDQVGAKVSEGSLILLLEPEGGAAKATKASAAAPAAASPAPAAPPSAPLSAPPSAAQSAPPAAAASATSLLEVRVPDIGDFKEVEVIELLVKPGDKVAPER